MDNVIDKAQSKLASLKKQAAEIEGQIQKWELFLATYNELASGTGMDAIVGDVQPLLSFGGVSKKAKIEEAAYKVLSDGISRSTVELFSIVQAYVPELTSSNELSVYLSSAKALFVNDRKTGWTVRKI